MILLKSDSQVTIDTLTSLLTKHENKGWIGTANSNIMRPLIICLHERKRIILLKKVKRHAGMTGNEAAYRLANEEARKDILDEINLRIPKGYNLTGAKLIMISQALAYKRIVAVQPVLHRRGTAVNLDKTC